MKRITFKVKDSLYELLQHEAKQKRMTISKFIEHMIDFYFQQEIAEYQALQKEIEKEVKK